MASFNAAHKAALDFVSREQRRREFLGMTAHDRHKTFMHDLVTFYGGSLPIPGAASTDAAVAATAAVTDPLSVKTDLDALKESYRFIRSCDDDANAEEDSWVRLAQRYYAKLYREYAIVDLSRFEEGKVGLRWRTQKEVVSGRGQLTCGARGCDERHQLASYELPFGYTEAGERKNALVKVRVCPEHARQLNYRREKDKEKEEQKKQQKRGGGGGGGEDGDRRSSKKRARSSDNDSSSSSSSSDDGSSDEERGGDGDGKASRQRQQRRRNSAVAPEADDFEAFFAGLFE